MEFQKIDSKKIQENGWKQGACLSINNIDNIFIYGIDGVTEKRLPNGLYLVLSQDCDILNDDLDKEPIIELILIKSSDKLDPALQLGKNPRKLQIKNTDNSFLGEILSHERVFISRTELINHKSSNLFQLTLDSLKILIRWMSRRYTRPGLPGEFNKRITSKIKDKIRKILSKNTESILGLLIHLVQDIELNPNNTYSVHIVMLICNDVSSEVFLEIKEDFEGILNYDITGIEFLPESRVSRTSEITFHEYTQFKQWDFDDVSYTSESIGETITDLVP
ncbi:MAG: hypothetical protein K2Q14_08390 [Gammaproteobacteria bacterium]|nr:hypothetical protein [Gammaproteobacteria bacterium]